MQGGRPNGYEDTGESGEAYEVEVISEELRQRDKKTNGKETLAEEKSVQIE